FWITLLQLLEHPERIVIALLALVDCGKHQAGVVAAVVPFLYNTLQRGDSTRFIAPQTEDRSHHTEGEREVRHNIVVDPYSQVGVYKVRVELEHFLVQLNSL